MIGAEAGHKRLKFQYAVVVDDLNHNMLSFVKMQGRHFFYKKELPFDLCSFLSLP